MSSSNNPDPNKAIKSDVITDEDTTTKLFKAKEYFKSFFFDVIDLEHGVDKLAVINEIKSKNSMSGANAWMLMCSIVIASIGLDLDSQAVIIGGMLISPLMSPILGVGLSVGINDMNTLKRSLSHFGIAMVIALLTSTIYFYLSPFDQVTTQIQARTEPTFLDVIIAFFGGIAGIVSYARKDISTTIPGVAIATALMPPLCVTGFGIVNGESWDVALSSFYLFFVNTFFVALATFLIVRFLDFPWTKFMDNKTKSRNILYISLFSLLVSIPSFFIFSKVLGRQRNDAKVQEFIDIAIGDDENYIVNQDLLESDSTNVIQLTVYGNKINKSRTEEYNKIIQEIGLKNTVVKISEINVDRINELKSELSGVEQVSKRLAIIEEQLAKKDIAIASLAASLKKYEIDSTEFMVLCQQVRGVSEDINAVNFGSTQSYDFNNYKENIPMIVVNWSRKQRNNREKEEIIRGVVQPRFNTDTVLVVHKYE